MPSRTNSQTTMNGLDTIEITISSTSDSGSILHNTGYQHKLPNVGSHEVFDHGDEKGQGWSDDAGHDTGLYQVVMNNGDCGQDPDVQQPGNCQNLGALLRQFGIRHREKDIYRFWSTPLLRQILRKDRIIVELESHFPTEHSFEHGAKLDSLADRIIQDHIKTFAALAMIDKARYIHTMIEWELEDVHLPFEARGLDCDLFQVSKRGRLRSLTCFQDWKTHERESFSRLQHAVNPRVLDRARDRSRDRCGPKHEDFDEKSVLPFQQDSDRADRHEEKMYGGYGIITIVNIHPDCHRFKEILNPIEVNDGFALKQLVNNERKEFEDEVKALKAFNGNAHPHIVTLLITWTYRHQYYLLFPLAKCDLDQYWEKDPNPLVNTESIRWMSEQVVGITSALENMHDPTSIASDNLLVPGEDHKYGRHGDLKPQNILLYDSTRHGKRILVIADMGLSKLNSILSRSMQSNGRVPATPRYTPPELEVKGAKVTRSYDIWTLGCLILEWVCWLLEGQSTREDFIDSLVKPYVSGSQRDMFFDMEEHHGKNHIVIKDVVVQKFADLHANQKCTQYLHDLLDLVQERMIVLRAPNRASSSVLTQRLGELRDMPHSSYFGEHCDPPPTKLPESPLQAEWKRRSRN